MEQVNDPGTGKRRAKFLIGGGAVLLILVGLITWAMGRPGSTAFYLTTSELVALGDTGNIDYRVNGNVVPGTIARSGLETTFVISDGRSRVTVVTDRALPDTFKDGAEVVAQGRFDGETLNATQVLAKCPSKFKAKA